MNRFKWVNIYDDVLKYLKHGGLKPAVLNKFAIKMKGNKLFHKNMEIIKSPDSYLRNIIYNENSPLGRDSLYHEVKQKVWGISKRDVDSFLKKQMICQMMRRRPTKSKNTGTAIHHWTPKTVGMDLIKIGLNSFPEGSVGATMKYILVVVHPQTGYSFAELLYDKKSAFETNKRLMIILNQQIEETH